NPPGGGTATAPSTKPATPPVAKPQKARQRMFFRPQKTALDLGAPLVALAAGDIDGDGTTELVALTTDDVVVMRLGHDATRVEERVALEGAAPLPRPRDPVGALLCADLDGDGKPEILARTSEHASGVILGWRDNALVRVGPLKNFPMAALSDGTT